MMFHKSRRRGPRPMARPEQCARLRPKGIGPHPAAARHRRKGPGGPRKPGPQSRDRTSQTRFSSSVAHGTCHRIRSAAWTSQGLRSFPTPPTSGSRPRVQCLRSDRGPGGADHDHLGPSRPGRRGCGMAFLGGGACTWDLRHVGDPGYGCGIDAAVLRHIFDPFLATKFIG